MIYENNGITRCGDNGFCNTGLLNAIRSTSCVMDGILVTPGYENAFVLFSPEDVDYTQLVYRKELPKYEP